MNQLLKVCIEHSRTVLLMLVFFLVAGTISYFTLPKESQPDVKIPFINVMMTHQGISPEDGERLLVRPMEKELRSIEGVKEMTAYAKEGSAWVTLEFEAGFNSQKALADVREKVDLVSAKLPEDTDEPIIQEVSFSLFPVLVVGLSGNMPQRTLIKLAKDLKDVIETIPQVLEVDIAGLRDDLLEVVVDPEMFETYNFTFEELVPLITLNNKLIAAGTLDVGKGRIPIKVPGVFETPEDVDNLPIKVVDDRVIHLKDVATLRKTYVDPTGFARIGGKPAIALEVKKRAGENVIETIAAIQGLVLHEAQFLPESLEISFFQDNSAHIRTMLTDLQNNLISAVALVMIVVLASLGYRSAGLVGVAIPGSFLTGIFFLDMMGITINIVVLFSLILATGMLVDGAIIVTELADRKMVEGMPRKQAYVLASQRMSLPIISSTATTLAAFAPLLFWPGIVGEFMKYLPMTLIATLTASMFMALIFIPTLGTLFGKASTASEGALKHLSAAEKGQIEDIKGLAGFYVRLLKRILKYPLVVFLMALGGLIGVYAMYGVFGKGIEFFPNVEPDRAVFHMRVRGNLSVNEIDDLLKKVESRILDMEEFSTIYSRSGVSVASRESTSDTNGIIFVEFIDWKKRRKATDILKEVEKRLSDMPGIVVELRQEKAGPPVGKPINLQLTSRHPELLASAIDKINEKFHSMGDLKDIDDSRQVPGIEWRVKVDRSQASRFGVNIQLAGDMVQFISNGLKLDDYRPEDSDDEVDIRLRYPVEYRNLTQIERLKIPTPLGLVPLGNFVKQSAADKVDRIERTGGKRMLAIRADVKDGVLVDDKVKELRAWLKDGADLDPSVKVTFKGEDEEQQKSKKFLFKAFLIALAVMAIILVTQFNSFYNAILILTAVIFSTMGVFLGLLMTHQPFSIVMNGIGVIALAGIVVNNNIVLIDTFQRLKEEGMEVFEAVLRTGAQRLRPVLLTTITTILGLIPMVLSVNIDFIVREVTYGAPSTQWWRQLSTSVAFGLAFATFLTLILTPALLVLGDNIAKKFKKMRG